MLAAGHAQNAHRIMRMLLNAGWLNYLKYVYNII